MRYLAYLMPLRQGLLHVQARAQTVEFLLLSLLSFCCGQAPSRVLAKWTSTLAWSGIGATAP